jgi:DME family drug/metabolite transporter
MGAEGLCNNPTMSSSPRLLVLAAAVCFGTTGTAQALGPDDTTPLTVGAARIAVGAVLLAVAARGAGGIGRPAWRPATLTAMGAAVALYQVTFFAAVERTGVGVGTVVALGSAPAFAGVAGWVANGEAVDARWARSTCLAVAGVAVLVLAGADATVDAVGVLLALGAGGGYAAYTVAAKRLIEAGHAPERVMAAGFGAAAVLLLPLLLTGDAAWLASPGGVALAVFLGAVPTAVAYVLFARGLRSLSSAETATLTLAEPLTAAGLGAVVLGERPGALAVVGAALVLAGLAVLAVPARRPAPVGAAA